MCKNKIAHKIVHNKLDTFKMYLFIDKLNDLIKIDKQYYRSSRPTEFILG